jgi:hypothetical protein
MHRNTGVMTLVVAPLAGVALWEWGTQFRWRPAVASLGAALFAIGAAFVWTASIVTNRMYLEGFGHARFGFGASRMSLPVAAAEWIDAHDPPGRLFCDFDHSSNLMYFTTPHREVPVLTNTWACPPGIMLHNILMQVGREPFAPFADHYDVRTVVVQTAWNPPSPLLRGLFRDAGWAVVDLGANHAILERRGGASASLVAAEEILPATFDVGAYVRKIEAADPVPTFALNRGAELLAQIGWYDRAFEVWNESLRRDARNAHALAGMAGAELEWAAAEIRERQAAAQAGEPADEDAIRRGFATRLQHADEYAIRALEIDPRVPWARDVRVRVADGRRLLEKRP